MQTEVDRYRDAFEHEIDANHKMVTMLGSVPNNKRSDPLFQRAVKIAAHMADCRQNFLELFMGSTLVLREPFNSDADFPHLEAQFTSMEKAWKEYLSKIDDSVIQGDFAFSDNGERWKIRLEAQLFQLIGHAAYHRGQVVLLIDLLGSTTSNTDYIDWFTENHPEGWGLVT